MSNAQMSAGHDGGAAAFSKWWKHAAATSLIVLLAAVGPAAIYAAECPVPREPRVPVSEEPVINIDKHKKQLLAYQLATYNDDLSLVIADALAYIERRAEQVKLPAVVLDIDETSLTNWENIRD